MLLQAFVSSLNFSLYNFWKYTQATFRFNLPKLLCFYSVQDCILLRMTLTVLLLSQCDLLNSV